MNYNFFFFNELIERCESNQIESNRTESNQTNGGEGGAGESIVSLLRAGTADFSEIDELLGGPCQQENK